MSDICPTVRIKSTGRSGYVAINESDFDPTRHERWQAPEPDETGSKGADETGGKGADNDPPDPLAGLSEDWREAKGRGVTKLRDIAAAISGRTVENKEQAVAVIEAEIAKRAATAPIDPPGELPPPPGA